MAIRSTLLSLLPSSLLCSGCVQMTSLYAPQSCCRRRPRRCRCLAPVQLMSCSLYEYLSAHDFRGLRLGTVRTMARHILRALSFLASPDVDIIHADLKPENIMLRTSQGTALQASGGHL